MCVYVCVCLCVCVCVCVSVCLQATAHPEDLTRTIHRFHVAGVIILSTQPDTAPTLVPYIDTDSAYTPTNTHTATHETTQPDTAPTLVPYIDARPTDMNTGSHDLANTRINTDRQGPAAQTHTHTSTGTGSEVPRWPAPLGAQHVGRKGVKVQVRTTHTHTHTHTHIPTHVPGSGFST